MADKKANLIVIGGGPGGYVSALRAAQLGAQVSLVEKEELGGTCLNWGCIPTKVFSKTAELLQQFQKAGKMGIQVNEISLDFKTVQQRKQNVVKKLKGGVSHLLSSRGVKVIQGEALLEKPGQVNISAGNGDAVVLEAPKIIVAAGSRPMELPGMAFDGEQVLNSTHALALEQVPASMLIVGGGVIGMEFASIFASFGTRVTLVEMLPEVLPFIDAAVSDTLKKELAARGVTIYTSAKVSRLEKGPECVKVHFERADGSEQIEVEKVLVAAGRIPNAEIGRTLGVEKQGAIPVNEKMETGAAGIYAVGDVTGGYQLAHVAYFEGHVAAENALGASHEMNYRAVPQGIFTYPEVAGVGLTEEEAREKYGSLKIGVFPFAASGKAMAGGETAGFTKIIAAEAHDEILGVFIIGPAATEMIHEAALAINLEATLEEVAETIHAHPTLSESLNEAALLALGRPLHYG